MSEEPRVEIVVAEDRIETVGEELRIEVVLAEDRVETVPTEGS